MKDIWYYRNNGRRERGIILICKDCGKERIDCFSRKIHPKRCEECRVKVRGEDHPNYVEGEYLRHGSQIRELKTRVLERDGNKCTHCKTQDKLEMHHIVPWKKDKEKRFDIDNCITLCQSCHLTIERTGKKATNETKKKLREAHLGKKHTDDHKNKIGESIKVLRKDKEKYKNAVLPGSRNGNSKLNEEQVRAIKNEDRLLSNKQLCVKYKIGMTTLQNIKNGKSWKHVN